MGKTRFYANMHPLHVLSQFVEDLTFGSYRIRPSSKGSDEPAHACSLIRACTASNTQSMKTDTGQTLNF